MNTIYDGINTIITSAKKHPKYRDVLITCYYAFGLFIAQIFHTWYVATSQRSIASILPGDEIIAHLGAIGTLSIALTWGYVNIPEVRKAINSNDVAYTGTVSIIFIIVPIIICQLLFGQSTTKLGLQIGISLTTFLIVWATSQTKATENLTMNQIKLIREDALHKINLVGQIAVITLLGSFVSMSMLIWDTFPGIGDIGKFEQLVYFSISYCYIILGMLVGVLYVLQLNYNKTSDYLFNEYQQTTPKNEN